MAKKELVKKEKLNIGIAYDGDGDRGLAVDEISTKDIFKVMLKELTLHK